MVGYHLHNHGYHRSSGTQSCPHDKSIISVAFVLQSGEFLDSCPGSGVARVTGARGQT